jgi:hypothetical protein
MRNFLVGVFIIISSALFGQQTEDRSIGSFDGIKVAEGIDVYLKTGEKEALKLEVRGTSIDNVITEVSGGHLRIHMREGRYRDCNVKVYVTYVKLDRISASSAANIFADVAIKTRNLSIGASSAATIDIPVDVESITVGASSAADIELRGKAGKADFEASSAGEIDAYDLDTDEADASCSSAGSIKLSVVSSIRARASSGGTIRYRGNPSHSNTNSSSGGSVRKTN